MDKKIRNMIITITSVVILVAVLIGLAFLPNNQNYTGEDQSLIINSTIQDDVSSVEVKNSNDMYMVNIVDGKCNIDTLQNTNISDKAFNTLKANSSDIKATQVVVEEASNLAEFGLSTPATTAKITYTDGTTIKLNIGNEAPMSAGTYVSINDSEKVYLFSDDDLTAFSYTKLDYVDKSIVPTKNTDGSNLTLNNILLHGGNRTSDVEINITTDANNSTVYKIKSGGIEANGDSTAAPAVVVELKNLKADSVVKTQPTTEDLANYGLDQPFATAKLTYSDRTAEVIISSDREGKSYIMNKAYPVIFEVQTSKQDWATATLDTLASKTIIDASLSSVNNLTVKSPDKSYTFNATTSTVTGTDNGTSSTVTDVTCNGNKIDSTNFKIFYQNMIAAKVDKFTTDKPNSTDIPVMSITITYNDTSKGTDTYNFYTWAADSNDLLVSKNGVCNSTVSVNYVNNILSNCDKLTKGETVDSVSF